MGGKMSYGREDTTIEPDFIEPEAPLAASGGVADNIGGTMQNSGSRGTLDETVLQTLKRDVVEINSRLKQVVYPHFPSFFSPSDDGIGAADNDISANCDL